MEKIKSAFLSLKETLNPSLIALSAYLVKILFWHDTSFQDGIVFACLCGLYGYQSYLKSRQPVPVNKQVMTELENLKDAVSGLKMQKSLAKPAKYF